MVVGVPSWLLAVAEMPSHEDQRVRVHRVDRRVGRLGERLPVRPGVVPGSLKMSMPMMLSTPSCVPSPASVRRSSQPQRLVVRMRGRHRGRVAARRAGVVFPLEVVVVASRVHPRRTCIEASLSPAHVVGAGVHVEQDFDVGGIRGLDHRLERQARVGDADRRMILQHVARALRVVGVERLRNQRQADHVDAHAGDFLHGLLRWCGRCPRRHSPRTCCRCTAPSARRSDWWRRWKAHAVLRDRTRSRSAPGTRVPFLVMRPAGLTRNTALVLPMLNDTAAVAVLNVGLPLSNAVAIAV